jgi:fructose/tagatose bisphosphate aldolase
MTSTESAVTTQPVAPFASVHDLIAGLDGVISVDPAGSLAVLDAAALRATLIDRLVATAVFSDGAARDAARWIIRAAAAELGAWPASIQDVYMAAGRGEYTHRTAPAINVRALAFDTMRAAFRAALANNCKIMLFELARSEMSYTQQRQGEYVSNALGAAIKEGFTGPVFIQGDHYQVSAKKWATDPEGELEAIKELIRDAIAAGYYNIDVDASTVVDLSLPTLEEQQELNAQLTAQLTEYIREIEPDGVTVSVGGEIGEVGLRNSTVEDLRAFMTQYEAQLKERSARAGKEIKGISKISVQTGTSHGGVVLPDGSIADVAVDFDTLRDLSDAARKDYGMGGAVQHGASTLPESAFGKFAEAGAVEVHLATAFQSMVYDHPAFPESLRDEIYAYLTANHSDERKEGQTDAQFFYSARKRGLGPFKRQMWDLPVETRDAIAASLEETFSQLMQRLRVADSASIVDKVLQRVDVPAPIPGSLVAALKGEVVEAGGAEAVIEEVEGE